MRARMAIAVALCAFAAASRAAELTANQQGGGCSLVEGVAPVRLPARAVLG